MSNNDTSKKKKIEDIDSTNELKKEMLEPVTKAKSKEDKELQDFEVETSAGGIGGGGG